MKSRICMLALCTSFLPVAMVAADQQQTDAVIDSAKQKVVVKHDEAKQEHFVAAKLEFDIRLAEYRSGRSAANAVLQANQRLLRASLESRRSGAAVAYDERAIEIAQFARVSLEKGTGTKQELKQATEATLDAMLKRLLENM